MWVAGCAGGVRAAGSLLLACTAVCLAVDPACHGPDWCFDGGTTKLGASGSVKHCL
jgi:hypothetical protein